jgi:hypothetical protein
MIEGRTPISKAFIAGTTRHVEFQIVSKPAGVGFQPDTLTLSIYDVVEATGVWTPSPWPYVITPPRGNDPTVTSEIVNGQNDADVHAFVDASGNVDLYLTPEDTEIEVPARVSARRYQRVLLFTWTWDGSPVKVGKHEIVLSIAPDRETVAS